MLDADQQLETIVCGELQRGLGAITAHESKFHAAALSTCGVNARLKEVGGYVAMC